MPLYERNSFTTRMAIQFKENEWIIYKMYWQTHYQPEKKKSENTPHFISCTKKKTTQLSKCIKNIKSETKSQ